MIRSSTWVISTGTPLTAGERAGMKTTSIFREALLRAFTRPFQCLLLNACLAAALCIPAVLETYVTSQLIAIQQNAVRDGANVYVVKSEEGTISSRSCAGLRENHSVIAVGQVYGRTSTSIASAPGLPLQLNLVSPGFINVVVPGIDAMPEGVLFGPELAEEVGWMHGKIAFSDGSTGAFDSVLPRSPRTADQSRWAYALVLPQDRAIECWLEARPGTSESMPAVLAAAFAEDMKLKIEVLASRDIASHVRSWEERPTKLLWLASCGAAVLLVAAFALGRRSEYALYRLLGLSRAGLSLLIAFEFLVVLGLACVLAASWVASSMFMIENVASPAIPMGLGQSVLTHFGLVGGIALISVITPMGSAIRVVKNRD